MVVKQAAPLCPTYAMPKIPERPEHDDPAHGEGSGESPFSVGIASSGATPNVTSQMVTFNNDYIPMSPEFFAERFVPRVSPKLEIRVDSRPRNFSKAGMPRRMVGSRSGR